MSAERNFCRQNHEKSCHKAHGFLRNFYGQYQCMKCTKFITGYAAYNHVKSHFTTPKKGKAGPKSAKRKREDRENEPECKKRKESDELQNHKSIIFLYVYYFGLRSHPHWINLKFSEHLEEGQILKRYYLGGAREHFFQKIV